MSNTASTVTTIVAVLGGTAAMIAVVSFWASRAIDALGTQIDRNAQTSERRFDRLDTRLDHIEHALIGDLSKRVAELERTR